jgi:hypothetical protein
MFDVAAPVKESRTADALRCGAAFGLAVAATTLLAVALAQGRVPPAQAAGLLLGSGAPAVAWGAAYGALRGERTRRVALWIVPPLVVLFGAAFVGLVLWPQADHGGLATAAVGLLTLVVALATAGVALLATLLRRATPRRQARAVAGAGALLALLAAVRIAAAPSPEDAGWISLPPEIAAAQPRRAPGAEGVDNTRAVMGALEAGDLHLARELAAGGVNVETHVEGCTVLALAAEKGDLPLVKAVLAGNARIHETCVREAIEAARRSEGGGEDVGEFRSRL